MHFYFDTPDVAMPDVAMPDVARPDDTMLFIQMKCLGLKADVGPIPNANNGNKATTRNELLFSGWGGSFGGCNRPN